MKKMVIGGSIILVLALAGLGIKALKEKEIVKEDKIIEIKENENRINLYYSLGDRNIYTHDLASIIVDYKGNKKELKEVLEIDSDYIKVLLKILKYKTGAKDGGTKLYQDGDINVIVCNTLEGNKDIHIGRNLQYQGLVCKMDEAYTLINADNKANIVYESSELEEILVKYQDKYTTKTCDCVFNYILKNKSQLYNLYLGSQVHVNKKVNNEAMEVILSEEDSLKVASIFQKYEDKKRIIKVKDNLYYDTGLVSNEARCGVMDGKILTHVGYDKTPTNNNEANFLEEASYQIIKEDQVDVLIEGVWHIFRKEE